LFSHFILFIFYEVFFIIPIPTGEYTEIQRHQVTSSAVEKQIGQTLVAHTCNPSYSGGRDQEDHGSKPVWTKIVPKALS
jgi:hypothetical protein